MQLNSLNNFLYTDEIKNYYEKRKDIILHDINLKRDREFFIGEDYYIFSNYCITKADADYYILYVKITNGKLNNFVDITSYIKGIKIKECLFFNKEYRMLI